MAVLMYKLIWNLQITSKNLVICTFGIWNYGCFNVQINLGFLKFNLGSIYSSDIQLGTRNSLLIKNNKSFSECVCQLEDEMREFKNEINQKKISLASAKNKITTKLEEIQALHSRVEELE